MNICFFFNSREQRILETLSVQAEITDSNVKGILKTKDLVKLSISSVYIFFRQAAFSIQNELNVILYGIFLTFSLLSHSSAR
jgi:hypothetical protein